MKTNVITELLKFEALPTTTKAQIMENAEKINAFLQKQDGFIDAELIHAIDGNIWYFIYHIENFEKLKIVGEKLRNNNIFSNITPLIVPESMSVMFFHQVKSWSVLN